MMSAVLPILPAAKDHIVQNPGTLLVRFLGLFGPQVVGQPLPTVSCSSPEHVLSLRHCLSVRKDRKAGKAFKVGDISSVTCEMLQGNAEQRVYFVARVLDVLGIACTKPKQWRF